MSRFLQKKSLIFLLLIAFIIGSVSIYFYSQKQAKEKEAEQTKILLVAINEVINLMDAVKSEMPRELLDRELFSCIFIIAYLVNATMFSTTQKPDQRIGFLHYSIVEINLSQLS